jgi:hypothetical protein
MKKWIKWMFNSCGLMILIIMLCGLLPRFFQDRSPQREFAIEELLVDASFFPDGWKEDPEGSHPVYVPATPLGSGSVPAVESVALNFIRTLPDGSGYASHSIYRLSNRQKAEEEFQIRAERWYAARQLDTPWKTPLELDFRNLKADQFYIVCSKKGSIPACGMLAQYEEYLVNFFVHTGAYDSDLQLVVILTLTDFEHLVKVIDQRMANYLK